MSVRAAANQFGYLLGAAAGGLAIALAGSSAPSRRTGRPGSSLTPLRTHGSNHRRSSMTAPIKLPAGLDQRSLVALSLRLLPNAGKKP
jgi:hypothetical protein